MTHPAQDPCPGIPKDLLEFLESSFRTSVEIPATEESLWEFGKRAGIKQVLSFLRSRYGDQQKGPVPNVFKQT